MSKFKRVTSKTWVFVAATAVIVGSGSTLAFALNENGAANKVVTTPAFTLNGAANMTTPVKLVQTPSNPQSAGGYTVVDKSKSSSSAKNTPSSQPPSDFVNKEEWKGLTKQQIDQRYQALMANNTPGPKDLTAQQAAAYAATIVKKAYGSNLNGYTAETQFDKEFVPNSDRWVILFQMPSKLNNGAETYFCSVNSVTGTILDAGAYNISDMSNSGSSTELGTSTNLTNSSWTTTAEQDISKLLPANVSITTSKIVFASQSAGVSVVSNLSNGAAFGVKLVGKDKSAELYHYFPNGYDESWDHVSPVAAG